MEYLNSTKVAVRHLESVIQTLMSYIKEQLMHNIILNQLFDCVIFFPKCVHGCTLRYEVGQLLFYASVVALWL